MLRLCLSILLVCVCGSVASAQVTYSGKVEVGYLRYMSNTIQVDPGPGWRGYYLNNNQNGVDLSFSNGIRYKEKLFAGVGISYLNFESMPGMSVFSDFEYTPFTRRVSLLLNTKLGYSHLWNQYENGTGTALVELGAGISFKITERWDMYLKSGLLVTQQSALFPLKAGVRF
jgi:hypothetical protein